MLKGMLIERWTRPSMLSSMCQHVARLQFESCAEKHSLCGTVMIHDGLNLRCLDQCCCVSFHSTSSSQGWRKMVVQSKFDPWVYILVFAECDLCRFVWESLPTEAYLCWHQCFSVVGWNSHDSWWPELNMFGSRPWCSFHGKSSSQSWCKRIVV